MLGTGGRGEHKGLGILTDWHDKARAQGHDYQSTIINISKLLLMLSSPFLENPPHLKGYFLQEAFLMVFRLPAS